MASGFTPNSGGGDRKFAWPPVANPRLSLYTPTLQTARLIKGCRGGLFRSMSMRTVWQHAGFIKNGRFRPPQGEQNAQDEDQIGRQKAVQNHRHR
jgi:hypothetical protein